MCETTFQQLNDSQVTPLRHPSKHQCKAWLSETGKRLQQHDSIYVYLVIEERLGQKREHLQIGIVNLEGLYR